MQLKLKIKKVAKKILLERQKKNFFKNQKNPYHLEKQLVKKAQKMGFTAEEYVVYKLGENNPADYISEFERQLYREKVRDYRVLLDNKIVFYNLIRNYAETNKIYAYKIKNDYIALEPGFEKEIFLDRLQEHSKLVYKKNNAGGGDGFKLLEFKENKFFINRVQSAKDEILKLLDERDYLIEEYCEQSDFENQIYPYSVNTIRIITIERDCGKYEVAVSLHRIGADKEKCVDNAHMGGLYSKIDIATGELTAARSRAAEKIDCVTGEAIIYQKHPITGSQIAGLKIPKWKSIVQQIEELHKKIEFMGVPMIAWDVALTNDGFKIIEGNTSSGMLLTQAFSGERNGKLGIWMKERGYIE